MDFFDNNFKQALLLLACIAVSGNAGADPSFDCAKASQKIEKIICQSEKLSRQDLKLDSLYKEVMSGLTPDVQLEIRKEQRQWLRNRNQTCQLYQDGAESCLLEAYRERNSELSQLLAFNIGDTPDSNGALKILRITPRGMDVPAGRQVVIQFDQPVVPIGKMERSADQIPIEITPALQCEWRWINTSALACQLREEHHMQEATRYRVVIRPGIVTEAGVGLRKSSTHFFTTSRPKVTYTRFVNWLSPGTPLIQVTFNQPVTKHSVENSLTLTARNAADSSPVSVMAWPDTLKRQLPFWMLRHQQDEQKVNDQLMKVGGDDARKVWIIEPTRELAGDATIWFDIAPGLVSGVGPEKGIEQRTIVSFETYPEFEFLGIRCTLKGSTEFAELSIAALHENASLAEQDDHAEQIARCAPLKQVSLVFTSPVSNSMVRDHVEINPPLDGGRKDYDPWENVRDWTHLSSPHRTGRRYSVWLPELLKAQQKYSVAIDSNELEDEFGRKLESAEIVNFFTGHREPRLHVNHTIAVLEKDLDTDVPLYVTNLDSIGIGYQRITPASAESQLRAEVPVEDVKDISFAMPMGARELVKERSGVIQGYVHPNPVPPGYWRDPNFYIQVTPFQVHAKFGHFNSLVWVTDFASGEEVRDARVTLFKGTYSNLARILETSYTSKTDRKGLVVMPGIAELDPKLEILRNYHRPEDERYFVKVEKGEDMALVPLDGNFVVRSSGVYPRLQLKGGHSHAWGITAQGVYKLGDTIDYKLYLRDQSNRHWILPEEHTYDLRVIDPQRKTVHEKKGIRLNAFGAWSGSFQVPQQGAMGWYRFELSPALQPGEKRPTFTWSPMTVLVSDFTPSPFKVSTELNGSSFRGGEKVEVTSLATLHSGGPFSDAEIRLTARLSPTPFRTDNPKLKGFTFGSYNSNSLTAEQRKLLDIRGTIDDFGQYEDVFTLPTVDIYYGRILVESAVKDDRGKFVASTASADFSGRDRFVGLRNTRWLYRKNDKSALEMAVVDDKDQLVAGSRIRLSIRRQEYKASRVKGPGNAYITQNVVEWVEQDSCEAVSAEHVVDCEFTPREPGYYQFVASTIDTRGLSHETSINGWVTGRGNVLWGQSDDANLQIVPEKNVYKVGETAKYLIKNPFPGAKALVTVERYGVIDSWIEELDTNTPVLEVKVREDYLPGFYVSVVVQSPRVDKPQGPGKVDLGKPSYRIGYQLTRVRDPEKEISIAVNTDKQSYKPRETVTANIHIDRKTLDGAPAELVIAVVDESVLALNQQGIDYYDPYKGFNKIDALDVQNYSLISRLVGRQKFEKKGASPGGGAGTPYSALRNLFKFVSYWNPSLTPDEDGNAEIQFEVPDNLTGWRVIAMALTPNDRMGLGHSNYKVTKPTEIRPVMPNQLVEGDKFNADFNVMNRTDKDRELAVKMVMQGPLASEAPTVFEQSIKVAAYKRSNVSFPVATRGAGEISFTVSASDKIDNDALQHRVTVNKRFSLETAANYGSTIEPSVSELISVPDDIVADVGEISAIISPSVIGNVDGAFNYIKSYPYLCWEQRLTRAVMASSYLGLQSYLSSDTSWPDAAGDISEALTAAANFQAPDGGMVYWRPSNQFVSPYLSAYTAIAFNWLREDGYTVPSEVESRLHQYLLKMLRQDVFPSFYSQGMSSSVRAVALAALSAHGLVNASDIERYAEHTPEMDLFGKAHFFSAANTVATAVDASEATLDSILAQSSQSGGKFQFNEILDDSYKYLLATPLRSNCAVLSSLVTARADTRFGPVIADIPFKLVRSITQSRGNRDHWQNTQENVFCMKALQQYSKRFESVVPAFTSTVEFDNQPIGSARFSSLADQPVTLKRALVADDMGKKAQLRIDRQGAGRMYYSARLSYALTDDRSERVNAGIEVRREYSVERNGTFELLSSPMQLNRGELVRVDLFVSIPTARHFVVLNDPVPGGLEPVNTDLATGSVIDAEKGRFKAADGSWWLKFSDWTSYGRYFWSFYHKELRHDSARFYADYLPAGNYHLSYTAQAIATGEFSILPVHSEEMYDPDVFGKGLPARLIVVE